jgi:hypothetical protein
MRENDRYNPYKGKREAESPLHVNIPWLRETKPNLVDWEKDMSR